MIAPLGRALILLSLLFATIGALVAFAGAQRRSTRLSALGRSFGYGYAAAIVAATLLMVYALVRHDFSVGYVAQVGSRSVPLWVTVVSLWSSLEGSILFWGLVLGVYIAAALWKSRTADPAFVSYANGIWLSCAAFFSFLIAGPAQPFTSISPIPLDGPGPNPLLQNHYLMAIHPPFLYLGYVGMTIPFGFACAALLRGRLGNGVMPLLRNSLLLAWTFLTIAIVLGGWWAYEVLGWGGYWAWDPVENASLLPWLTATAALHSAIVMERRGILRGWTVTLVLASFLLTILGTFMTRSGVFNSVHSFTQSSIGPTILVFLAVALVASVLLLAMRIDRLSSEGSMPGVASRESMFLVNNLFFVLLTFTILVGTVFPLIVEAVQGVQMSVGRPYFDRMTVPVGVALLFLLGVGPALPWGRAKREEIIRALVIPAIGGGVVFAVGFALGVRNFWTLLTLFFGGYAAQVTIGEIFLPVRQRMSGRREGVIVATREALLKRGQRRLGSYIVHGGAVIIFVAIAVSSTMGVTRGVQLKVGQTVDIGRYALTLDAAEGRSEAHRESIIARISVREGNDVIAAMSPSMNFYARQREPIGTPDVLTRLSHDLYLSVMNIDAAAGTAGVRAMINPMVSWIWGATALMGFGGVVALFSRRRVSVVVSQSDEVPAQPAAAIGETA